MDGVYHELVWTCFGHNSSTKNEGVLQRCDTLQTLMEKVSTLETKCNEISRQIHDIHNCLNKIHHWCSILEKTKTQKIQY